MSDNAVAGTTGHPETDPFENLMSETSTTFVSGFSTTFRGYDKEEVDAAIAGLDARVRAATDEVAQLKQHQRRAGAAVAQIRAKAERLEAELRAADERRQAEVEAAAATRQEELEALQAALAAAEENHRKDLERAEAQASAAREEDDDALGRPRQRRRC